MIQDAVERETSRVAVSRRMIVSVAVLGAALAYCYADVFAVLARQWLETNIYSYAFLIPLISLYLVWRLRTELGRTPRAPRRVLGGAAIGAGLLALHMGRVAEIVGLQEISLIPVLAGLILWCLGAPALRLLAFPVAYLLFMMPFWDVVIERLHYPFQQMSARFGAGMLDLIGVPVFAHDTYLELPNIVLEVARVCSGVSYLIAVVAVGIPLAYFSFADRRRQVLLVAVATLIAILGNAVRVALIGFLSYHGVTQVLHGPGHILEALSVAALGYAALFGGVGVLSRMPAGRTRRVRSTPVMPSDVPAMSAHRLSWLIGLPAAALVLGGAARASDPGSSYPVSEIQGVPVTFGSWSSVEERDLGGPAGLDVVEPGDIWRTYSRSGRPAVHLYVGWFGNHATKGRAPYWTDVFESHAARVQLASGRDRAVEVNHVTVHEHGREVQIYYWFDLGNRTVASRVMAKLHGLMARFMQPRGTPLVYVVASSSVGPAAREAAVDAAEEFARELMGARAAAHADRTPQEAMR
jgi:EpsI family protein